MLATAAQNAMQVRGSNHYQPIMRDGGAVHHEACIHPDSQGPVGGISHANHGPLAEGKGTE